MIDQLLTTSPDQFDAIRLGVASPEEMSAWSHGEVIKPETINYRTQRPERDGLFDERIFGPTKDYECYCGKYKKIRYKGIVCDKCGVEVTRSSVRRERMGHINLAVPICHIWYVRGVPSTIGLILDISMADLERIIYFASFIILEVKQDLVDESLKQLTAEYEELKATGLSAEVEEEYRTNKQLLSSLAPRKLLTEIEYYELSLKFGSIIRVGIGSEAIFELLKKVDLKADISRIESKLKDLPEGSVSQRKFYKRLRLLTDMQDAHIKPEWLVLTKLPVIPPDLRPMVQLDGGRFAASDLNDLYRRVINRNNRLKKLIASGAPEVISRNEKRMLQEAVDALMDNATRRGRAPQTTTAGTRPLRSLSDMLRGKQGRFRQNLLGKRVDYSGRSVIVVGPKLKLNQCGLPKIMALELFKPFVISRLISDGFVHNVKNASRLIEQDAPEVWDILEQVTKNSYVLLNRAPTLHRLGIQAFQPILIEGKAIQIHPLVCHAYNADFDGDQMAVHVPLSEMAKFEAKEIMQSTHNLIKPASGEPVIQARYDIVFGCFYLTTFKPNSLGEGKVFSSKNEAILAMQHELVDVRAQIKVRIEGELVETCVGRILFNNILPKDMPFDNRVMNGKTLKKVLVEIYEKYGREAAAEFSDRQKDLGFEYATKSGLTISIEDVLIPASKTALIKEGDDLVANIDKQYNRGLITTEEKNIKVIEVWNNIKSRVEETMVEEYDRQNPVYLSVASGARGSFAQIVQMGGMKGLVVNPAGEIISLPIKASFKEGLNVYEYFLSTHGARKGRSDTSLRTSDAGYLTRRLVDVAQDIVITQKDCGSKEFLLIKKSDEHSNSFRQRIVTRFSAQPIKSAGKKLFDGNTLITDAIAEQLANDETITEVAVRSPLNCRSESGLCQHCYGLDLAILGPVRIGESVGTVAAQAIGEPGTQLTMKTFHLGGVSGLDITTGLPRVEELFEARIPKRTAPLADISGKVSVKESKQVIDISLTASELRKQTLTLSKGFTLIIKDGESVREKQAIATRADAPPLRAPISGKLTIKDQKIIISGKEKQIINYNVPASSVVTVEDGDVVQKGTALTDDHLNLAGALKICGVSPTQAYIIAETQKIYSAQGQDIHDKHIEIIVRQMFSKVRVIDGGNSLYISGQLIERLEADRQNEKLAKAGKKPLTCEQIILGVSRVSIKTDSFLSAASFQETTSVLIDAAIKGAVDHLKGLKENVIIGRLIPAGTGLNKDYGHESEVKSHPSRKKSQ